MVLILYRVFFFFFPYLHCLYFCWYRLHITVLISAHLHSVSWQFSHSICNL
jgi:hypothetical protein